MEVSQEEDFGITCLNSISAWFTTNCTMPPASSDSKPQLCVAAYILPLASVNEIVHLSLLLELVVNTDDKGDASPLADRVKVTIVVP